MRIVSGRLYFEIEGSKVLGTKQDAEVLVVNNVLILGDNNEPGSM
jgi:hypothetical protein